MAHFDAEYSRGRPPHQAPHKEIRHLNINDCQYSETNCSTCGSGVHACGQLISGCVWDMLEYFDFTDEGFGFDKKELKKVFKKFYRVQNQETQNIEGAGLGLYISRQIIKNHKGKINVFSEGRGKGTRFMLCLPIGHNLIVKNKSQ